MGQTKKHNFEKMYELIDGTISIAAGIYAYLVVLGKVRMGNDEEKSQEWINKHGKTMKMVAPILVLFGLFRFYQAFLG